MKVYNSSETLLLKTVIKATARHDIMDCSHVTATGECLLMATPKN